MDGGHPTGFAQDCDFDNFDNSGGTAPRLVPAGLPYSHETRTGDRFIKPYNLCTEPLYTPTIQDDFR